MCLEALLQGCEFRDGDRDGDVPAVLALERRGGIVGDLQQVGLLAGRFAAAEARGERIGPPPPETAHGALLAHITGGAEAATFQPMNVNFGMFPPIDGTFRGKERKQAMAKRALDDFNRWLTPSLDKLARASAAA